MNFISLVQRIRLTNLGIMDPTTYKPLLGRYHDARMTFAQALVENNFGNLGGQISSRLEGYVWPKLTEVLYYPCQLIKYMNAANDRLLSI